MQHARITTCPASRNRLDVEPRWLGDWLKTTCLCAKQANAELDQAIEEYEGKAFNLMHKHEIDFMGAYCGHMKKVYKEMDALRKKANQKEFEMRREQLISKL